ncbi:MAG: hypothetical protein ACTSP3_15375 [Candidatus Heimdallarchaeaceae archaeon]
MINGKYPINGIETEHFNFTLLRIASLGILAVYISEMINRMISMYNMGKAFRSL